jgi:hypothetical protein
VQLALTPYNRWQCATADLVSAASAAGFAAVGVNADRVDAAASSAYAASGVRCHEMLALVVSDDEPATMAHAEQLANAAAVMGAEWVLTVFTTPLTTPAAKLFSAAPKDLPTRASGWPWNSARSDRFRRSETAWRSCRR